MESFKRVSTIFAAVAVVLILDAAIAYWMGVLAVRYNGAIASEMGVIHQLAHYFATLRDAEAGQQAYAMAGDDHYLRAYEAAVLQIQGDLVSLDRLVKTGDLFKEDVETLRKLTAERVVQMEQSIQRRKSEGPSISRAAASSPERYATINAIREQFDHMMAQEESDLRAVNRSAERVSLLRTTVFALTTAVSLGFIAWAYRRIRLEILHREKATAEKADREATNRAKDQFLAVLSHELRNPLAPVLLAAELMERDRSLPESVRDTASMIARNVDLEVRLVNDLLDVNRIVHGKLELQCEPLDLHEKIQHVAEMCGDGIESHRLTLTLELRAPQHQVRADPARIQQVIWNLLRNAIKFTPPHGRITVSTENSRDGWITMSVRDTGAGIAPEYMGRIFEAFEQGGKETTRRYGGLGLGLSICKGIVDLHGGRLAAASEGPGKGATFTLELPVAFGATAAAPRSSTGPAAAGVDGVRLLLVEDNADTAKTMSQLLESFGYEVRVADGIESALRVGKSEEFDLLLCDIGLPDGSGLDLMRQLRQSYAIKGIALSGYGMDEDIRRSKEAGFVAHLTKPIDLERLRQVLHDARSGT